MFGSAGDTCIGGGVPKASESAISCGFEALLDDQIEFSQKENSWEQGRIWEVLDAAEQVESCPELHGEGIEEKIDIVLLGLWQQKAVLHEQPETEDTLFRVRTPPRA